MQSFTAYDPEDYFDELIDADGAPPARRPPVGGED